MQRVYNFAVSPKQELFESLTTDLGFKPATLSLCGWVDAEASVRVENGKVDAKPDISEWKGVC